MNKLIKLGNTVIVSTEEGKQFTKNDCTKEEFIFLADNLEDEEALIKFFNPKYVEECEKRDAIIDTISSVTQVPFLTYENNCIYWKEISPHSLPIDLADSITEAYKNNDEKAIKAYKNFWILLSLNFDEDVRKNLYWFLNKHGIEICSNGFFISYRNAQTTNRVDDEGNPIYTDAHSGTTKISIGHRVSIPRNKCDSNPNELCSKGLHLGGSKWLEENYYGNTGLVCICNPCDVVAVP